MPDAISLRTLFGINCMVAAGRIKARQQAILRAAYPALHDLAELYDTPQPPETEAMAAARTWASGQTRGIGVD